MTDKQARKVKNVVQLRARQCAQSLQKKLSSEELMMHMKKSYSFSDEVVQEHGPMFELFYNSELKEMDYTGNGPIGKVTKYREWEV